MLLHWLYDSEALSLDDAYQISLNARSVRLFGISSAFLFIGLILISLRMWRLLNLLNIKVGIREAIRVNLASMSLGLLLPGLIGVDALRATYFCIQKPDQKPDAISCIIVDRIIGLYALLLLATLATVFAYLFSFFSVSETILIFLVTFLAGFSIAIVLMMNQTFFSLAPIRFFLTRIPSVLQATIESIHSFRHFRLDLFIWVTISVASQGITVFSFITAGILINDSLPILAHLIFDPIALFFNSVPITPGGLGITESVFAYLYQLNGSENGPIIALIGRLNQYWVYIIAGLPAIFLVDFKISPRKNLAKIETDLIENPKP